MKFLVAYVLSSVIFPSIAGIQIQDFFEQRCTETTGRAAQNAVNWLKNVSSSSILYFPLVSQLELFRLTEGFLQKRNLGDISEAYLKNSCIVVRVNGLPNDKLQATMFDYCGKSFDKVFSPARFGAASYEAYFPGGLGGMGYVSLTDNLSFNVYDVCWEDGQRGFIVMSTRRTFDQCTERVITEHLKTIGFKEEYFAKINYNSCSSIYCDNALP